MDIRKYGIVIAIAILVGIFIFAVADAVAPQIEWRDCYNYPKVMQDQTKCPAFPAEDVAARTACLDQKGEYQATYDAAGCINGYECSTCNKEYNDAMQSRNSIFFYVAIILGVVSIIVGFLLPRGTINEWVGLGFVVGGVIGLFIGTVQYWNDLSRIMRPVVIAIELVIVLFIVYKRMNLPDEGETQSTTSKPVINQAQQQVKRKK